MLGDGGGDVIVAIFSIFKKQCFRDVKMYCNIFTPPLKRVVIQFAIRNVGLKQTEW